MKQLQPVNLLLLEATDGAYAKTVSIFQNLVARSTGILDIGYWRHLLSSEPTHGICLVINSNSTAFAAAIDQWNNWYSTIYEKFIAGQPEDIDLYVIFTRRPLKSHFNATIPKVTYRVRRFCLQGGPIVSHPKNQKQVAADAYDAALTRFLETVLVDAPVKEPEADNEPALRPEESNEYSLSEQGQAKASGASWSEIANVKRIRLADLHFQLTDAACDIYYRLAAGCEVQERNIHETKTSLEKVQRDIKNFERDQRLLEQQTQPDTVVSLTTVMKFHTFSILKPTRDFKGVVKTKFPIRRVRGQWSGTARALNVEDLEDPTTFEYHMKNNKFKDAYMTLQVYGFKHEIYAKENADLAKKIDDTAPLNQRNLTKQKKLTAELREACKVQQRYEILLTKCKADLQRLAKLYNMDWDFVQTRRDILVGDIHGLAAKFGLTAEIPWKDFLYLMNDKPGDAVRVLNKPASEALEPISEETEQNVARKLSFLQIKKTQGGKNLGMVAEKFYNPVAAYATLLADACTENLDKIERLHNAGMQENQVLPSSLKEFDKLVDEAVADLDQVVSAFKVMRHDMTRCLKDGLVAQASKFGRNTLVQNATGKSQEAGREATAGSEVRDDFPTTNEHEVVPIGIYAAIRRQLVSQASLSSIMH
ncbi:hypothetical protein ABW21_db0209308 [Orbilia brochopaga]|nr:hypothetical protein ABW21_db0209308 [Drechslerella brochopaga]